jgi:hypothetical protein
MGEIHSHEHVGDVDVVGVLGTQGIEALLDIRQRLLRECLVTEV